MGPANPVLVKAIREKSVDSPLEADIIITTAHKATGSEFHPSQPC
jgi:hypothetical protein